jgi:hypothetical protein
MYRRKGSRGPAPSINFEEFTAATPLWNGDAAAIEKVQRLLYFGTRGSISLGHLEPCDGEVNFE